MNDDIEIAINRLRIEQRIRRYCIKSAEQCNRSIEAYIVGFYQADQMIQAGVEVSRKDAFAVAHDIRDAIERIAKYQAVAEDAKREAGHLAAMARVRAAEAVLEPHAAFLKRYGIESMVAMSATSREPWSTKREDAEQNMRALVRNLPVWDHWAIDVRGISEKTIGVIVGECGNLSNYATKGKLFKRLGLAVMDGRRQGNPVNKADYAEHGYSPTRRAQVWVFLSDILYNQQAKVSPVGHYAQICRDHKAYQIERNEAGGNADRAAEKLKNNPTSKEAKFWREGRFSPGHIDKMARRYMSKIFLADLLREWKSAERVSTESMAIAAE